VRILAICQRYWPEQFQITNICEGLVSRGHDVTVLCGLPNVGLPESEGRVLPEYKLGRNRVQEHNGVKIVRSFEIGRRTGVFWRIANYYSFWKTANRKVLNLGNFDVCLAYQLSPAMMCDAARILKQKRNVPYLLYCCDLWPESMKAMLGNQFSGLVSHYGKICGKIYREASRIAVESPAFMEYFEQKHQVLYEKLIYIPQFSTDESTPQVKEHEGVNFVFMGNMGTVQGIPLMLEAFRDAVEQSPNVDMKMHFVGDGVALPAAKEFVSSNGLANVVVFHGRHPIEDMSKFYAIADVCIMALDDSSLIGATIPSKLQGYMAAGKSVIAAASGGTKYVVEDAKCGRVVSPNDTQGFANAIVELASNPSKREACGKNARKYFEQNFSRELFLDKIENELCLIAGKEN
jgi:glycosyltransferase involved in cell wall biosynthesis